MNIVINGENKNFDVDSMTVGELLVKNDVKQPEMVSVQLNGEFLQADEFESKKIKDADEVDFLYFMGGGQ